jgi:DNA helicase-2/ATP-dependent DNA helicase PcrA
LIEKYGVAPWNILAVTFTNKAANEMKERIKHLLKDSNLSGEPTVGTFHSTCVRILRKHLHLLDFENTFTIYDVADQQILMKRLMEEAHIDPKMVNPKAILNHISNAKSELIDPEKYRSMASNYFTERVAELYGPYQDALRKNNALDFDDLIMQTIELFRAYPEILDQYQEKFKFICVDEYQDTNHSQYTLINMLAEKYRNICVIGDSDQSIYSWRGADILNINDFEKDYTDAKTVLMEQNYRSTHIILDAAHEIIVKNQNRKDKKLWTKQKGGDNIIVVEARNERHEGEVISEKIRELTHDYETPPYNKFAVLYRTNAQSRAVEEVFLRYGIPYKIYGGIKFYDRKEVKDMIAYLRAIQNPADSVSLLRIINTPARKIGTKTIEAVQLFANLNGISLFEAMRRCEEIRDLNEGKMNSIKKFIKIIDSLKKANDEFPASGVIKHALDISGYKEFIMDGTPEGEARYENISELISVASKYDLLDPGMSLNVFLEEIALIADIDSLDEKDNAVILMTVHSAKGLEFDNVFIIGLEEGIFPHSRSLMEPEELEEERRLMYVAVTRAMKRVFLIHARQRMLYGETQSNARSQFLDDIPVKLLDIYGQPRQHVSTIGVRPVPKEEASTCTDLKDGDKVIHTTFGEGVVVSIQGEVATIGFKNPDVGVKRLALSVAPLVKIEG